jgi:phosphoribosylformylglycinamidine synthase
VQLGGPGMRIGMGGGAASSMATGANAAELDFDSVQRGNPEIERRAQEVINHCWALARSNPMLAIHDVGAGGLSNAFPELTNDAGRGARFDLRKVPLEETGLAPKEIWCNESQERYVLAIAPESLEQFRAFCERERCPFAVVGVATEERSWWWRTRAPTAPVDMPMDVLLGKPPKMHRDVKRVARKCRSTSPASSCRKAAFDVLSHPTVASKRFLVTIGDRTVGGLTHRDQMVGPWQVPVADCAVTLADYKGFAGEAMSMGERTPLAALDAPASGRMAVAEAITNLLAAPIELERVKLSANWMAACGEPGRRRRAVRHRQGRRHGAVPGAGRVDPGRQGQPVDAHAVERRRRAKKVTSPVSLIVTAFASLADVRGTLTPQLSQERHDAGAGRPGPWAATAWPAASSRRCSARAATRARPRRPAAQLVHWSTR